MLLAHELILGHLPVIAVIWASVTVSSFLNLEILLQLSSACTHLHDFNFLPYAISNWSSHWCLHSLQPPASFQLETNISYPDEGQLHWIHTVDP